MKLPAQDKIDDGIFSAIGLVMVTTSQVHAAMAFQLLRLLYPADQKQTANAMVITFGMKVDTLLGLMKSLVGLHFSKIAIDFDAAVDVLRDSFTKKRDVLAHHAAGIATKPDRITVYKMKTVGKITLSKYDLTEKQIRKWAADIHSQAQAIDRLLTSAGVPKLEASGAIFGSILLP